MSWSIGLIGKTSNVVAALKQESEKLDGVSRQEYDASLPHIVGLVEQNFEASAEAIVKVQASGHGYTVDGSLVRNQVQVTVEPFFGKIV